MYKYKKRNPFSTQSSPVYDEGNQHIVDIQKIFRNPFQRIVSIVTLSLRFRKYELRIQQEKSLSKLVQSRC